MKKLMVLLCALTLITVSGARAQTDYTASCGGSRLLTVQYDENALQLDTESYLSSSRGSHTWLGMFYDGTYTIELSADRYSDLPADSDANQLSAYLCSALSQYQCAPLELYSAGLPFVIFSLNGPMGQSYYAAALSNGYVVHFEIYNMRGGADGGALTALKALLNGVSP